VQIVLKSTDEPNVTVYGEVKVFGQQSSPTVAHVQCAVNRADVFQASPGRHSFHFSVTQKCTISLTTIVDGGVVGPEASFDATQITAGRRYHFDVP
jgi:hypothetical protein